MGGFDHKTLSRSFQNFATQSGTDHNDGSMLLSELVIRFNKVTDILI
jgi:hypothetical protein